MKNFPKYTILALIIAIISVFTACAPTITPQSELGERALVTETAVILPTVSPSPTATETVTAISTKLVQSLVAQTVAPTTTNTPLPTATATLSFPEATPVYAGTKIPVTDYPISQSNFQELTQVAQWGYGTILGSAFAPEGQSFVVGSATGFMVYDAQNLDNPPRWIPLEQPYDYENISFSQDGNYLLLEDQNTSQVYRFADGHLVTDLENALWQKRSKRMPYDDRRVVSPDNELRFESYSTAEEEDINVEIVVEEMFDNSTGDLLYQFPEDTMYVQYDDYHEPEGCDLYTFSMCGNAFDPSAMQPYQAAFAPTNDTLSIMYRASNLWDRSDFSILRIYQASDGKMLAQIGSFSRPVTTFAYAPDGQTVLVGYGNGTIELWDIVQETAVFEAHHFDAPIIDMAYSYDGQFVVVQRPGWVEVRQTDTGVVKNRHRAATFALSPTTNVLALGGKDGTLKLQDIERDLAFYYFKAHDAELFALAFSPDGRKLTSSGADCRVQNWDAASGSYLHDFAENVTDAYDMGDTGSRIFIKHMAYVPDTDQLLGYGSWSRVVNWQAETGESRYLIEPEPLEYYNGMKTLNPHFPEFFGFNQATQSFLIDNAEYNIASGERLGEYQLPDDLPAGCSPVGPTTTDGSLMFTQGFDEHAGQICILNAGDYQLVQTMPLNASMDSNNDPMAWLYLSPNGNQLLVSTYSGVIHVFQVTTSRINASKNIKPERLNALYPW